MRWEQHASLSSPRTTILSDRWFPVCLALTVFHLCLSVYLPPSEDELYYWAWAQSLQLSYFDHPPMVAYLIAFSTAIFGNNIFAIRFVANAATLAILLIIGLQVRRPLVRLLIISSPIVFYFSFLTTPDIPLLLFWSCYSLWATRLNQAFHDWNKDPVTRVYHRSPVPVSLWAIGGIILGLGLLSKYTMVLALLTLFLLLARNYRIRSWVGGFFFHLGIGLVLSLPVIWYNVQNGFAPLKFQWQHSTSGSGFSLIWLLDFILGQGCLVTFLPLLLFPWVILQRKQLSTSPLLQASLYFFALPFSLFLLLSTRSRLEANWPLMSYLTFWPLAQFYLEHSSFPAAKRVIFSLSVIPAVILNVGVLLYLLFPPFMVPANKDRLGHLEAKNSVAQKVAHDYRQLGLQDPLFTPTYQWTAMIRFQGIHAEQIYPGGRLSHFTMKPKPVCEQASVIALVDTQHAEPALGCFRNSQVLKSYPFLKRGRKENTLQLVRFSK